MPELPEIETVRRELEPHLLGQRIIKVVIRNPKLRWPVSTNLSVKLTGKVIENITRRSKYLLIKTNTGTLIVHFGMSGSLQIIPKLKYFKKHDHVIIILANNKSLRYNDPRRFGCMLWTDGDPNKHPLLNKLGPEPLTDAFSAEYLYQVAQSHKKAIKLLLMDGHIVAGIGNIYANEALFWAKIHPLTPAKQITKARYEVLVVCVKKVLLAAINKNGTTFKDFVTCEGMPGGFKEHLGVYGREGKPCVRCCTPLKKLIVGQRYTVFCPKCQVI